MITTHKSPVLTSTPVPAINEATSSFLARIEKEKKLAESVSLGSRSTSNAATPLWVILHLYNKAPYICYIHYMLGLEELVSYLSPIDLQLEKYPEIKKNWRIPAVFQTYQLMELTKLLIKYMPESEKQFESAADRFELTYKIQKAIYLTTADMIRRDCDGR